jgi:putative flippase GtrA
MDILALFNRLKIEVAKFGAIGLIAYVIDVGIFNLLLHGALSSKPLTAKVASAIVATTFAYFGNRFWTFRDRAHTSYRREFILFVALNGVGIAIGLVCLATSHYLLKFTSPLADNISGNGFGLLLGTLFRFWSYRKWVFLAQEPELATQSD